MWHLTSNFFFKIIQHNSRFSKFPIIPIEIISLFGQALFLTLKYLSVGVSKDGDDSNVLLFVTPFQSRIWKKELAFALCLKLLPTKVALGSAFTQKQGKNIYSSQLDLLLSSSTYTVLTKLEFYQPLQTVFQCLLHPIR